jgi:hypothetical protein
VAAIVIDSPRWLDGWGETISPPRSHEPVLRLVGGGRRRPDASVVRRRRLAAVVVAGLVLAVALAVASAALTRPARAGAEPVGRRTHLVEQGETYWSIAADQPHEGDLRVAVDALIDANGGRALFPGDRIELP